MERQAFDTRDASGLVHNASTWTYLIGDPLPSNHDAARKLLGSKAFSLALLNHAGLDTLPAFAITSDIYRDYLARGRELPNELWDEVRAGVAGLESATGRAFGKPPNPLTLAVRSGAPESMPGILATFLHCGLTETLAEQSGDEAVWQAFAEFLEGYAPVCLGSPLAQRIAREAADLPPRIRCERWLNRWRASPCGQLADDPESVLRATIAAVFNSWASVAARRYRDLDGHDGSDAPAVTVQAMFAADVAGVVFSRNPIQPEANELVVEATAGSGRPLVGGKITPMRWTIDRSSLAGQGTNSREMLAFSEFSGRGLPQLCREVLAIEALFNEPVDVEFGYAAGRVVYFQARPLKKTSSADTVEQVRASEGTRSLKWAAQGRRLWVRHNLAETLPAPTPLTWELWRAFMGGRGGLGHLYRRLGYRPSRRVGRDGFVEIVAGRIYADSQRLPDMLCAGYPFTFERDALLRDPAILDQPPTHLDLEQLDPWFLWRWPSVVFTIWRASLRQGRLRLSAAERFDREVAPRVRSFVEDERRVELPRLSLEELIDVFNRRRQVIFDDLAVECFLPGMLGAGAWNLLTQRLTSVTPEPQPRRTVNEMLAVVSAPLESRQRGLLRQVAHGQVSLDTFLQEFGHRGPGEMDLSSPRWREMPGAVMDWAGRVAGSPGAEARAEPETLGGALDRARHVLRRVAGNRAEKMEVLLEQSIRLLVYREIGKHEFLRAYDLLREVVVELACRTGLGDGIHFLEMGDIADSPRQSDLRQTIASRRDHHYACRRLYLPAVLEIGDLEHFGRPPRFQAAESIRATSLSRGAAAGRVLLLADGEWPTEPVAERVIVARTVEPACLPMMADAAALVVEQGGVLSHVALLARQLAIPTVVVEGITAQLAEGEFIRVDADRGFIERRRADSPTE